jgi:hypothetical protein
VLPFQPVYSRIVYSLLGPCRSCLLQRYLFQKFESNLLHQYLDVKDAIKWDFIPIVRIAVSFTSDAAVPDAEKALSEENDSFCSVSFFPFDLLVITAEPEDSSASSLSVTSLFLVAAGRDFGFLNIGLWILKKNALKFFISDI